ncbi:hypothetical protein FRC03_004263 [Tulasnella sp. 419]|nr:hypothetical protein FRC03_004263 [Tulasnella sp. 419]
MTEQIPPLPQHLIDLTLQYLLPPSPPLPHHLLSAPLLQRHRFLSIDASSAPETYFLWPRRDGSKETDVVQALEGVASKKLVEGQIRDIYYDAESDEEMIKAYVIVPCHPADLAIVYAFVHPSEDAKETAEWRYHDVVFRGESMPSYRDLESALKGLSISKKSTENKDSQDTPSAEDYWDGYGSSPAATPLVQTASLPSRAPVHSDSDEAYLSRYANVETAIQQTDTPASSAYFGLRDSDLPSIPSEARNTPTLYEDYDSPIQPNLPTSVSSTVLPVTASHREMSPQDATISSISGIYKLWLLSQSSNQHEKSTQKERFMELVLEAIENVDSNM